MKALLSNTLVLIFFLIFTNSAFASTPDTFSIDQKNYFLRISNLADTSEIVVIKNKTEQNLKVNFAWKGYDISPSRGIDFADLTSQQIELQPFGITTVTVKFSPPERLKPGDYYGSLILSSEDTQEKADFTLRYPGEQTEKIVSTISKPDDLEVVLENQGNITSEVKAKVAITNFFGQVVQTKNLETSEIKALDKDSQTINVSGLLPGRYQVILETTSGSKNVTETKIDSFWIYPEAILATIVFLGILIILLFNHFRKKRVNV